MRSDDNRDNDDKDTIIAIDSTGIKITNRGPQWMQDIWNIRKKKGYLKIHIAIDINTKEIFALEVTDEKVHNGRKVTQNLIEHILKNNNYIQIKSAVSGDGSYDNNENFKYLQKKKIRPSAIKVRKNSMISSKNNNGTRN